QNVTTVIATVVAMLLLDWRLAVFSLAVLPLFVYLSRRVGAQRKRITSQRQATMADISTLVEESLSVSGILLGKTMGRSSELAERFADESANLAALEVRGRMAGRWVMATIQTSFAVMPALVYLVARLYDAERGAVRIDGTDVRDATFASLAAGVGLVSQDTYLFHASVADNLRFAKPGAAEDELVAAAKAARIHDLIASLPDGYD